MFRLAARYQDGILFWLDASPSQLEETERILQLKPNPHFLRWVTTKSSGTGEFTGRKMALTLAGLGVHDWSKVERLVGSILLAEAAVHSLWNETARERGPQHLLTTFRDIEADIGIPVTFLLGELASLGVFRSPLEKVEVVDKNILTFLKRVLQVHNLQPYLVWEFAMHFASCGPHSRLRHQVLNFSRDNDCFRCTEDVTGLAAHATPLYAAFNKDSDYKLNLLLHEMRNAIIRSINSAWWLPAGDKDRMIKTLVHVKFVHGFPSTFQNLSSLNAYYSYLPNSTGNLWRDYYNAASASWLKCLDGSANPFPLLSAGTNVLSADGTIFIPAGMVWQPLFHGAASIPAKFGSLGYAVS
ncbi:unnamed protein product, partial [Ixodes hexagonus]